MKRETRANLIFLTVFLSLSLPGAVILFKKKLDPTSAPMGMPDFVRRRLPYMVPLATPDSQVIRVIPPLTGDWVARVVREQGGGEGGVLMRGPLPVTSADRVVQVTGVKVDAGGTTVYVIAWEGGYGTDPKRYEVSARSGDESFAGRVVAARAVPVPQPVKRELMSGGYVKPPAEVVWLEVRFDAPLADKRPLTLALTYVDGDQRASSQVNVSTK